MLDAATDSGSYLLLTEDIHPGLSRGGVRVVNPLAANRDPLLNQLRRH
ncbi:MAG: hypothetical protein ACKOZT_13520 [Cyanobium sp.]